MKKSQANRVLAILSIPTILAALGRTKVKSVNPFSIGVKVGNHNASSYIQAEVIAAAKAKRFRRAQSPFASTYARQNVRAVS